MTEAALPRWISTPAVYIHRYFFRVEPESGCYWFSVNTGHEFYASKVFYQRESVKYVVLYVSIFLRNF